MACFPSKYKPRRFGGAYCLSFHVFTSDVRSPHHLFVTITRPARTLATPVTLLFPAALMTASYKFVGSSCLSHESHGTTIFGCPLDPPEFWDPPHDLPRSSHPGLDPGARRLLLVAPGFNPRPGARGVVRGEGRTGLLVALTVSRESERTATRAVWIS